MPKLAHVFSRLKGGLLLLVALVVLLIAFVAYDWNRFGIDVSACQANQSTHQRFSLPASATEIKFISTPRHSNLTFRISKGDFDLWCQAMNLHRREISPETPCSCSVIVDRNIVRLIAIDKGVYFSDEKACGISGTYSPSEESCCAQFACY